MVSALCDTIGRAAQNQETATSSRSTTNLVCRWRPRPRRPLYFTPLVRGEVLRHCVVGHETRALQRCSLQRYRLPAAPLPTAVPCSGATVADNMIAVIKSCCRHCHHQPDSTRWRRGVQFSCWWIAILPRFRRGLHFVPLEERTCIG